MHQFLEELAAPTPTPGGGSVSALAGALAAGLLAMVAGLTLAKGEQARPLAELPAEARRIMARCEALVTDDAAAYDQVVRALKLPKNGEEEKRARAAAVQEALRRAALVPMETARQAVRLLELVAPAATYGIPTARSDVAVAAWMARSALAGSLLNVRANTGSLKDAEVRAPLDAEAARLEGRGVTLFHAVEASLTSPQ